MLPIVPACLLAATAYFKSESKSPQLSWLMSLVLLLALVAVENVEEKLGNTASFKKLVVGLNEEEFKGVLIPSGFVVQKSAPQFVHGPGTKIASYRFRFMASGFYLLKEKPEYVANYGNNSLWEWQRKKELDHLASLQDLVLELKQEETMVVLTKQKYRDEIEEAYGSKLLEISRCAEGSSTVLALSNQSRN